MLSHKPNKLYWLLTQSTLHCTSKKKKEREKKLLLGKDGPPLHRRHIGVPQEKGTELECWPGRGSSDCVFICLPCCTSLYLSLLVQVTKVILFFMHFDYLNCWTYKYVTDGNLQEQRTFQRGSLRTSPPVFCLRCLIVDYGFLGLEVLLLIDDSRWIGCNFVIVEKYIDLIWFDLKERALWRQWILVVEYSFLA